MFSEGAQILCWRHNAVSEGACLGGEVRLDAGFQKEQRENGAKSEETVPGRST